MFTELPSLYQLPDTRRSQPATGPWDWGFHTVGGGVDPGELNFRPRGIGIVDI